MKIVTWNCNRAFRRKYQALEDLEADLLIIQECENPAKPGKQYDQYREWAGDYLWHGTNQNMGLGIFSRHGTKIKKLDWSDKGLQFLLACRVNDSFNLVGVWTKDAKTHSYIGQLWKYLQTHKSKLAADQSVICGDFNSNVIWDKKHSGCNHSDVVRELDEIGIVSHYHHFHDEEHGEESQATLFLLKNLNKPYHLDYAFSSKSLLPASSSEIIPRDPEAWLSLSDHLPLKFTITA